MKRTRWSARTLPSTSDFSAARTARESGLPPLGVLAGGQCFDSATGQLESIALDGLTKLWRVQSRYFFLSNVWLTSGTLKNVFEGRDYIDSSWTNNGATSNVNRRPRRPRRPNLRPTTLAPSSRVRAPLRPVDPWRGCLSCPISRARMAMGAGIAPASVPRYTADGATRSVDPLRVGASFARHVIVTDEAIRHFARASGDMNPVHLDDTYAAGTRFGGRVAHGILLAGYISAVLANDFPGSGIIYLGQTLRFTAPARPGQSVRVSVTVSWARPDKRIATLVTVVADAGGRELVTGEATVLVPAPTAERGPGQG